MKIEPKFKIGDKIYTNWGEEVVITEVEIDVLISYKIARNGIEEDINCWMEDELRVNKKEE